MAYKPDKRTKALYGVFYVTDTGQILGQTERSFDLGCSRRRVSARPVAKEYRKHDFKVGVWTNTEPVRTDEGELVKIVRSYVVRFSSTKCAFIIDFSERIAMDKRKMKFDKYTWRNPRFSVI